MTAEQWAIVQRIDAACDNRILTDEMNNPVTVGTGGLSLSSVEQDAIAWRLLKEIKQCSVGRFEDVTFAAVLALAERVLLK